MESNNRRIYSVSMLPQEGWATSCFKVKTDAKKGRPLFSTRARLTSSVSKLRWLAFFLFFQMSPPHFHSTSLTGVETVGMAFGPPRE